VATRVTNAAALAIVLALLAVAFYAGRCSVPEPAAPAPIVITQKELEKHEPDAKVGKLEQLARPRAQPRLHQVAPAAGAEEVIAFVEWASSHELEPLTPQDSVPAAGNGRPAPYAPFSFSYRPGRLELFPYDAAGATHRLIYAVHDPRVAVRDTAIVVQGNRFWWVDDVTTAAGIAAAAYGVGADELELVLGGSALLALGRLLF
jgi:hypothetical protein